MCEKRKEKMIIEIALLVMKESAREYREIFGNRFWENCEMPETLVKSSFVTILSFVKNPQKRFWENNFHFWERFWEKFGRFFQCKKRITKEDV